MREQDIGAGLQALGLERFSYPVVALLPLTQVAWADGELTERERRAIERFAQEQDLLSGGGQEALERWLAAPLAEEEYRRGLRLLAHLTCLYEGQDPRCNLALIPAVLEGCRRVAAASGGLLGMLAISAVERRTIEEIRVALDLLHAEAVGDPHNLGGVGWSTLLGEVLDEPAPAAT